jgi:hypothetical protein
MYRGGSSRGNNPFDDDDDGGFGSASRSSGGGGYGASGGGYGASGGGYGASGGGYGGYDTGPSDHDTRLMMANRRMEASSANSLRALNETMRIGIDTTEELERQAESLDKTERRLDEIHVELDKGERNMRRIKSPFAGIGNYFSRKKSIDEVTDPKALRSQEKKSTARSKPAPKKKQQQAPAQSTGNVVVDKNLDEMEKALFQLRGVGEVIGCQLDDSERQLDRVQYKLERDHIKVDKLNKDIKRELYK